MQGGAPCLSKRTGEQTCTGEEFEFCSVAFDLSIVPWQSISGAWTHSPRPGLWSQKPRPLTPNP